MAWKVTWTVRAQEDKESIFSFWNENNKSNTYSKKLNGLFNEIISLLKEHPLIGRPTNIENVRIKSVRKYLIIYEIRVNEIIILRIWDGRRNPETML